jgi:hypothetical protein
MRGIHGRPAGSGEAATIKDAMRARAARRHGEKNSPGHSAKSATAESTKGMAHRLSKEQQGSGRVGRVKD